MQEGVRTLILYDLTDVPVRFIDQTRPVADVAAEVASAVSAVTGATRATYPR